MSSFDQNPGRDGSRPKPGSERAGWEARRESYEHREFEAGFEFILDGLERFLRP